jgi:hypothetical protein
VLEGLDAPERPRNEAFRREEVVSILEIEPELSRCTEESREPKRRIGADIELLAHDAFDSGSRDATCLGDRVRRQPERIEEFLSKHLAGMHRSKHLDLPLGHVGSHASAPVIHAMFVPAVERAGGSALLPLLPLTIPADRGDHQPACCALHPSALRFPLGRAGSLVQF